MTISAEKLAAEWLAAKAEENAANAKRVGIEADLIKALAFDKSEGSTTYTLGNGVKVTLTGKLSYKADIPALITIAADLLPENERPIKFEPKLDETGCRWIRENRPEVWVKLAEAIETKAAKTGVSIKSN